MEGRREEPHGRGLAGADLAGEQPGAVMLDEKLQPRLHLRPGLEGKHLFRVGAVGERRALEAEEGLEHGGYS